MSESELQKAVDRSELVFGAKKAIKRAKQRQLDKINEESRKLVKAYDNKTGQARFVPESDIMRNPSGFTPIEGSVADMLRTSDRKKQERIIRKGSDSGRRQIERLKAQGLGSKIKPRPGKTKAFKIGGAMLKNPGKADLDKDGQLSGYEKKRGMAIEKAMAGKPQKANLGLLMMKKSKDKGAKGLEFLSPLAMLKRVQGRKKGGAMKYTKGGGRDMGSRQAMQDKLDKTNKDLKRLRPDRKKLLEMLDRTKPTPKPLAKGMGGGLTEATNRLRAQGKMGGGMMNTMGYKKGKSVMAKGCKMGRKKPTKLY